MNLWSAMKICHCYLVNNCRVLLYSSKIFVNYANKPSSEMYTRGFRSLIQLKRMELWIGRGGSIGAWLVVYQRPFTQATYRRTALVYSSYVLEVDESCVCLNKFFSYTLLTVEHKFFSRYAKTSRPYSAILYGARIFKRLWSPGIDSKEWIPPAYVAWRAGTITLFLLGS